MSRQTLDRTALAGSRSPASSPARIGVGAATEDIAGILSMMTTEERRRAYEHSTFSRRELFAAAAREPERMPMLNGEFEWIAMFLADHD